MRTEPVDQFMQKTFRTAVAREIVKRSVMSGVEASGAIGASSSDRFLEVYEKWMAQKHGGEVLIRYATEIIAEVVRGEMAGF